MSIDIDSGLKGKAVTDASHVRTMMPGLILVGTVLIVIGFAIRLLLQSKRWIRDVIDSQDRLPWLLRGWRHETSEKSVRRGVLVASYFGIGVGLLVLVWAFYVGVTG